MINENFLKIYIILICMDKTIYIYILYILILIVINM